ncbi:MAG: hypothetical protein JSS21_09985 [Proteobacteria bacterium]|nr:hypothetical protein [Pseudomonadota bacterium]
MIRILEFAAIAPFFVQVFKPKPRVHDASEHDGMVVDGVLEHLRELRSIAGEGEVCHPCTAILHPPADGEEGPASVQVTIDGVRVGRLCHRDATRYVQRHGTAKRSCRAAILGGGHDTWDLGIWLDMQV